MFKKIFSLLKNKVGETVDAIIITPVWIFVLLIIGSQMQIYQAKQDLEDGIQIVSRYVMMSDSPTSAINTVNNYLSQRDDANKYDTFTVENITKVYYKTGTGSTTKFEYTTNSSEYESYWEKGNMVEITLKRKTPYYGSSMLTFCVFDFEKNADNCFTVVEDVVQARCVVFIADFEE